MKETCWGLLPDGRQAELYTIANEHIRLTVSTLGATITALSLPDRSGCWSDVALGFDTPAEYLTNPGNLGALIGRYAGRIAGGCFPLNGEMVRLGIGSYLNFPISFTNIVAKQKLSWKMPML